MILSFRHKGLKLLFEKGDRSKVEAAQADKIERILARLTEASEPGKHGSARSQAASVEARFSRVLGGVRRGKLARDFPFRR